MNSDIVAVPRVDIDERLEHDNIFAEVFGNLSVDEWENILIRSIDEPTIGRRRLSTFPVTGVFSHSFMGITVHTASKSAPTSTASSKRTVSLALVRLGGDPGSCLISARAGEEFCACSCATFRLNQIIGFEPSGRYCSVARATNPFITFLSGDYLPNGILPADKFNLVVSWSVFSHLSPLSAKAWLRELERVTARGAAIVITTWGMRFLNRLSSEREALARGEDIHWYSKICLEGIGDLNQRIQEYRSGKFVWFTFGQSALYGEAFVSPAALAGLLQEVAPRLIIEKFDDESLPQDAFILRRI